MVTDVLIRPEDWLRLHQMGRYIRSRCHIVLALGRGHQRALGFEFADLLILHGNLFVLLSQHASEVVFFLKVGSILFL